MNGILKDICLRVKHLPRDDRGQSALFAVVTLMLLVIVIGYSYNVGFTVSQRVRLQNAADAAAYSGAVVEANALSSIAWLNNCQTYLHSRLQEHMQDVVVYTTASAISEWGRFTKADSASDKDRDEYEPQVIPHFFPIPGVGLALPPEEYGSFTDTKSRIDPSFSGVNGHPPANELDAAFDNKLYSKLTEKYGVAVSTPADVINYTKLNASGPSVFNDAVKWIAERRGMQKFRRGEMWIRQLSQVAAGIARALPEMVRNEITYSIAVNAPSKTRYGIFPDPRRPDGTAATDTIFFDGEPQLIVSEREKPHAFFKYDNYAGTISDNRFLTESRRQAQLQGFDNVESSGFFPAMKPEIAEWWDEIAGQPKNGGEDFKKYMECWNGLDRTIYNDCASEYICPVGYAPGPNAGAELAHPRSKSDAADGHWHFKHGHSHSENCKRSWGGLCIGWCSFWCIWKCLIQEIAGKDHHMQYLNHEVKIHWTGVARTKSSDYADADPKHVYCEIARSNRSPKSGTLKNQYPDIIPGMRNPKLCFVCKFKVITIFGIPFIFCTCKKCSKPKQTKPNYTGHKTQGCFPGFIWEYIVIMPPWEFFENWPKDHGQSWPGHFYTKADWEARFSGDKYYYDISWMTEPIDMDADTTVDFGGTGFAPIDALINKIVNAIIPDSVINILQQLMGRFNNWKIRKSHHCFMVCPLCHKKCPLCNKMHWGQDKDGDQRSDTGMSYKEIIDNGHDYNAGSYANYDLDLNVNDGAGGSWQNNMSIDRFVREWTSPRNSSNNPDTRFAPTVMVTENFMRYGVTVALWAPHETFFFVNFFGRRTGHVALATARVGFVERSADGSGAGGAKQIVTGAGEIRTDGTGWTLDKVWNEFLDFPRTSKTSAHSNLYYGNWGARLVSVRDAILHNGGVTTNARRNNVESEGGLQAIYDEDKKEELFWEYIGATFCYKAGGEMTNDRFRALVQGRRGDGDVATWKDFIEDYLKGKKIAEVMTP